MLPQFLSATFGYAAPVYAVLVLRCSPQSSSVVLSYALRFRYGHTYVSI